MWLREKRTALLATLGVIIVLVPAALYLHLLTQSPLSIKQMDFNDNGIVTLSELMYASAYGVRTIHRDDDSCREYCSLNDGLSLRVDCDEP